MTRMRKIIVALLICSTAALVWRAHDRDESGLAFDRFWIDHIPTGPKDKFETMVMGQRHHIGVFGSQSPWAGRWEGFRFSARDGGKIELTFPASDARETVTVRARRCDEAGFDYCLELSGSSHGARRYYSKREWDQGGMQNPLSQLPATP
jgi:hypothetical protein